MSQPHLNFIFVFYLCIDFCYHRNICLSNIENKFLIFLSLQRISWTRRNPVSFKDDSSAEKDQTRIFQKTMTRCSWQQSNARKMKSEASFSRTCLLWVIVCMIDSHDQQTKWTYIYHLKIDLSCRVNRVEFCSYSWSTQVSVENTKSLLNHSQGSLDFKAEFKRNYRTDAKLQHDQPIVKLFTFECVGNRMTMKSVSALKTRFDPRISLPMFFFIEFDFQFS